MLNISHHKILHQSVHWESHGTTLRGSLYLPSIAKPTHPAPAVVLTQGFSGLIDHDLQRFSQHFASAGIATLCYDHRGFGASAGIPRQEALPNQQIDGYQTALRYLSDHPAIDAERLGVWGTSYSGGHVLVLGALDTRVRCIVAQVPFISGAHNFRNSPRNLQLAFIRDEQRMAKGIPSREIPVVSSQPTSACALPGQAAYSYFKQVPHWKNRITLRSLAEAARYEPQKYLADIATHIPVLMVIAEEDSLNGTAVQKLAFTKLLTPKKQLILPGDHFSVYQSQYRIAANAARDWFAEHL